MTRDEWIKQAEDFEKKAQEFYQAGDQLLGELYEQKAAPSRFCADFGVEDTEE